MFSGRASKWLSKKMSLVVGISGYGGPTKVMSHLMFGILELSVDQLLCLRQWEELLLKETQIDSGWSQSEEISINENRNRAASQVETSLKTWYEWLKSNHFNDEKVIHRFGVWEFCRILTRDGFQEFMNRTQEVERDVATKMVELRSKIHPKP